MRKLLATAVLTAISFSANAFPVEWTLNNVVFEDGGIATGSFTYDADNWDLSNVSIVTSGGSLLPGNTYDMNYDAVCCNPEGGHIVIAKPANPIGSRDQIQIELHEKLTNAGGTIPLVLLYSAEYINDDGDYSRSRIGVVSGTVSAVPVPAAVWLFGSALAGLGWFRRRRTA